jgi:uncharacterized protein YciW
VARSTVRLPAVAGVIDRLLDLAAVEDELAKQRVAAAEAQIGHRLPYLQHVRDERNGYFSVELAVAAGVALSVWQGRD